VAADRNLVSSGLLLLSQRTGADHVFPSSGLRVTKLVETRGPSS
jgi:hypothetical protein